MVQQVHQNVHELKQCSKENKHPDTDRQHADSVSVTSALVLLLLLLLHVLLVCRMAAAVASLFQDISVRFLEERTDRALQRCAADAAGNYFVEGSKNLKRFHVFYFHIFIYLSSVAGP